MTQDQTKEPFVFQIGDLTRLVRQSFDTRDGPEVTRAQAKLLVAVWRNPGISQQALAVRLDIATMSVCRQVDTLEARGMLERRPDPSDRRVRRLFITEKTAPVLDTVLTYINEISDMLLQSLSPDERTTLTSLLGRVIDDASAKRTEGETK